MITKITNIAQLRARKGTVNALAETLGYYTASGGGNVHSEGAKFKTAAIRAVVHLIKVNYEESVLSGERTT